MHLDRCLHYPPRPWSVLVSCKHILELDLSSVYLELTAAHVYIYICLRLSYS